MKTKNDLTLFPDESGNIVSSYNYFMRFKLPKESKILDIGCNYGTLIYNFYLDGYQDVYGVDLRERQVGEGKSRYTEISDRINLYNGESLPFEDSSLDAVTMFDVIEHIPDIEGYVKREVARVLKPGGMFIFQTPNKIINIPWEVLQRRSFTAYKEYHISLQTLGSLKKMLKNAGFSEVKVEKYNILTDHNQKKVKRALGPVGFLANFVLQTLAALPLAIFPNFWGWARK